jgi:hypothetical protein
MLLVMLLRLLLLRLLLRLLLLLLLLLLLALQSPAGGCLCFLSWVVWCLGGLRTPPPRTRDCSRRGDECAPFCPCSAALALTTACPFAARAVLWCLSRVRRAAGVRQCDGVLPHGGIQPHAGRARVLQRRRRQRHRAVDAARVPGWLLLHRRGGRGVPGGPLPLHLRRCGPAGLLGLPRRVLLHRRRLLAQFVWPVAGAWARGRVGAGRALPAGVPCSLCVLSRLLLLVLVATCFVPSSCGAPCTRVFDYIYECI